MGNVKLLPGKKEKEAIGTPIADNMAFLVEAGLEFAEFEEYTKQSYHHMRYLAV